MQSPILLRQFEKLKLKFPLSTLRELPSGAALITLPEFQLPQGWSSNSTCVYFLVPVGYPGPCPDCFWASAGLRLANGQMPQAAQDPNAMPETGITGLWFSWHVVDGQRNWNPSRDDLLTYASLVVRRFEQVQ